MHTYWYTPHLEVGLKLSTTYCIARNIGGELNLVDWRFWKQTAKLKSSNIYSPLTSNCAVKSASVSAQKQRASCGDLPRYVTDHDGIHHHCNSVRICRVLRFPFARKRLSQGWGPEVLGVVVSSHAAVYNIHFHVSQERTRGFNWWVGHYLWIMIMFTLQPPN